MNAMLVYVMVAEGIFVGFTGGWYDDDPHNALVYWIQKHVPIKVWHSRRVDILLYVILAKISLQAVCICFGFIWKLWWMYLMYMYMFSIAAPVGCKLHVTVRHIRKSAGFVAAIYNRLYYLSCLSSILNKMGPVIFQLPSPYCGLH